MIAAWGLLIGLAAGSFLNAAIDRVPRGVALGGRSRCDACGRALSAWEVIPLLSYVALRGRCAGCRNSIGLRTPLVEATTAAAFVALAIRWGLAGVAIGLVTLVAAALVASATGPRGMHR